MQNVIGNKKIFLTEFNCDRLSHNYFNISSGARFFLLGEFLSLISQRNKLHRMENEIQMTEQQLLSSHFYQYSCSM